jgi:crotonobetainyl-CoA:carnitine CoA-transferase CaiB-like acyl-CoA transferase
VSLAKLKKLRPAEFLTFREATPIIRGSHGLELHMLPLTGIRVAEFCQVLAGPFCGALLADMGADVIKIESPEGDLMRAWPPMLEGYSQYFASVNRNKRSVAFDLKSKDGLAAARELALSCDVILENFRPGVMAKFDLDYASLSKLKPSLVYCSVSAYGQTGPRATEGGFDMTVQAMSGVMSVTGDPGGRPAKCGIPIADFTAGLYAAYSVAAALTKVKSGAAGEHIDVSMLGGMLGIAHLQTSELFATGRDPVALGSAHPMNAPYAAFRCADGYFAIAAGTNRLWEETCNVIRRPDLARDQRFASPELRAKNQNVLRDLLENEFGRYTAAELLDDLRAHGVPCAPINTYSQVLADPQVQHMAWVEDMALPSGVTSKVVVSPQRISGERLGVYRRPPKLGEHTAEVLEELARAAASSAESPSTKD